MSEQEKPASGPIGLHRPLAIRLGIAAVLLIALVIAWQLVERTPPPAAEPSASGPMRPMVSDAVKPAPAAPAVKPAETSADTPQTGPDREPVAKAPAPNAHEQNAPEAADPVPPVLPSSPPPKLAKGPYLQVGVFMHPANANALKAKLEAQGLPVHLATRVQVGPFKDKQEAELMREKLQALGQASVLINQ